MTDLITRLAARVKGRLPVIKPVVSPRFAEQHRAQPDDFSIERDDVDSDPFAGSLDDEQDGAAGEPEADDAAGEPEADDAAGEPETDAAGEQAPETLLDPRSLPPAASERSADTRAFEFPSATSPAERPFEPVDEPPSGPLTEEPSRDGGSRSHGSSMAPLETPAGGRVQNPAQDLPVGDGDLLHATAAHDRQSPAQESERRDARPCSPHRPGTAAESTRWPEPADLVSERRPLAAEIRAAGDGDVPPLDGHEAQGRERVADGQALPPPAAGEVSPPGQRSAPPREYEPGDGQAVDGYEAQGRQGVADDQALPPPAVGEVSRPGQWSAPPREHEPRDGQPGSPVTRGVAPDPIPVPERVASEDVQEPLVPGMPEASKGGSVQLGGPVDPELEAVADIPGPAPAATEGTYGPSSWPPPSDGPRAATEQHVAQLSTPMAPVETPAGSRVQNSAQDLPAGDGDLLHATAAHDPQSPAQESERRDARPCSPHQPGTAAESTRWPEPADLVSERGPLAAEIRAAGDGDVPPLDGYEAQGRERVADGQALPPPAAGEVSRPGQRSAPPREYEPGDGRPGSPVTQGVAPDPVPVPERVAFEDVQEPLVPGMPEASKGGSVQLGGPVDPEREAVADIPGPAPAATEGTYGPSSWPPPSDGPRAATEQHVAQLSTPMAPVETPAGRRAQNPAQDLPAGDGDLRHATAAHDRQPPAQESERRDARPCSPHRPGTAAESTRWPEPADLVSERRPLAAEIRAAGEGDLPRLDGYEAQGRKGVADDQALPPPAVGEVSRPGQRSAPPREYEPGDGQPGSPVTRGAALRRQRFSSKAQRHPGSQPDASREPAPQARRGDHRPDHDSTHAATPGDRQPGSSNRQAGPHIAPSPAAPLEPPKPVSPRLPDMDAPSFPIPPADPGRAHHPIAGNQGAQVATGTPAIADPQPEQRRSEERISTPDSRAASHRRDGEAPAGAPVRLTHRAGTRGAENAGDSRHAAPDLEGLDAAPMTPTTTARAPARAGSPPAAVSVPIRLRRELFLPSANPSPSGPGAAAPTPPSRAVHPSSDQSVTVAATQSEATQPGQRPGLAAPHPPQAASKATVPATQERSVPPAATDLYPAVQPRMPAPERGVAVPSAMPATPSPTSAVPVSFTRDPRPPVTSVGRPGIAPHGSAETGPRGRSRTEPEEPRKITLNIGRIDVLSPAPETPAPMPPRREPRMSLEQYLSRRRRGLS